MLFHCFSTIFNDRRIARAVVVGGAFMVPLACSSSSEQVTAGAGGGADASDAVAADLAGSGGRIATRVEEWASPDGSYSIVATEIHERTCRLDGVAVRYQRTHAATNEVDTWQRCGTLGSDEHPIGGPEPGPSGGHDDERDVDGR